MLRVRLEDLAKAEADIGEAEKRVARQAALIQKMTERSESTAEAEKILRTLEETLVVFRNHRQIILDSLKGA